jgi:hypothetical protein
MRAIRRIILAVGAAGMLGVSMLTAAPAWASSPNVYVDGDSYYQYLKTCDSTTGCNTILPTSLAFIFQVSLLVPYSVTINYKVTNGTAINGVDFNTPATGQVTIPANTSNASLVVPLVNEGQFGTSKTFTVTITGVNHGLGVTGGPATGDILGGNVPLDCSYSNYAIRSMSLTCTARPANQTWQMNLLCAGFKIDIGIGSEVTGDGTSSAVCQSQDNTGEGFLEVDS